MGEGKLLTPQSLCLQFFYIVARFFFVLDFFFCHLDGFRSGTRQEIALDFVLDHMEGVKNTPGFLELKQEPELLMEIIFRQAS